MLNDQSSSTSAQSASTAVDAGIPLIDVSKHLRVLWTRKWTVVLAAMVALAAVMFYALVTPPSYTAVATLLLDPRQEQVTEADSVLPGIGTDSAAIASQVNVLGARGLLERVFAGQNLSADSEFSQPRLISQLTALLRGKTAVVSPAAAFDEFRRRVNVQRLGLTYVLEVRFTSEDPVKAARLANAVVEEYLTSLARDKSDANLEVTHQLQARVDIIRGELADAELAAEQFKVEHSILAAGSGTTILQSQIDQLTAQISAAREQARESFSRAERARAILASGNGIAGMDDLLVSEPGSQLRAQHNDLAAEVSRMQSRMGPRHPSLLAAKAEVSGLEGLMRQEATRALAQLEADAKMAEDNVRRAEDELAALGHRMEEMNRQEVTLRQLERDADVARNLLEEFMRRVRETDALGTMQSSDAKVIGAAAEPRSATWPRTNLMLLLAAAAGLTVGCAIALILGERSPTLPPDSNPAGSPPALRRRRAPSFAETEHAWRNLGTQATRVGAPAATARIKAFLDGERKGDKRLFVAAVSTLSSEQQRSELLYALAWSYASAGISTLVLDLDPYGPVLYRQPAAAMQPLTAFAGDRPPALVTPPQVPFVVIDDRAEQLPLAAVLLNELEKMTVDHGFELMLVGMPKHFGRSWSDAVAARLDAEVVIARAEEVLADRITALAAQYHQRHQVAYLTLTAVPVLVNPNAEAVCQGRFKVVS